MSKMGTRGRGHLDKSTTSVSGCPEVEYFWAADLSSDSPSESWLVKDKDLDDDDEDYIEHTLFIRLAVLGSGAVPGEQNVVLMESPDENGESVKAVIINLTRGVNSMGNLSLTVDGRVGAKFTLVEGSGPVSISGNHLLDYPKEDQLDNSQTVSEVCEEDVLDEEEDLGEDEEEDVEDEDEEEDEEEEESPIVKGKPVKRKGTPKSSKQKQKAKMEVEVVDDEEEDIDYDDDDDLDDESDDEKSKKKKRKGSAKDVSKPAEKGKAKAAVGKDSGKKGKKAKK